MSAGCDSKSTGSKTKSLICDEATSALDVTIQKQIMELLEDLKEKNGLSFIFICHNLALVQMFCDRVLVLYEGKVVESGIPDDIINEPRKSIRRDWWMRYFRECDFFGSAIVV